MPVQCLARGSTLTVMGCRAAAAAVSDRQLHWLRTWRELDSLAHSLMQKHH